MQITTPEKGEASLLVLLLEELLARYVSNPVLARLFDLAGPVISVRGGASTATVRFDDGVVALENGIAADAWVQVSGDVDSLLAVATLDDPVRPFLSGRVRIRPRLGGIAATARRLLPTGGRP